MSAVGGSSGLEVASVASARSVAAEKAMLAQMVRNWYQDPWSYCAEQARLVAGKESLDEERLWRSSSHLMYARYGWGKALELYPKSAITGASGSSAGKLESAHLVGAVRRQQEALDRKGGMKSVTDFGGQIEIKWLIDAEVVPPYADINCDANRILMEHYVHSELDRGRLKIAPDTDLVLARLLSEAKYQMDRLNYISNPPIGSTAPPVRPPFTLFYESLERLGAIFRLFGTVQMPSLLTTRVDPIPQAYKLHGVNLDDPRRATVFYREENPILRDSMLPALPPILVPVSMNLLIYASKDRVEIGSPAPTAVYEETSFWFIADNSTPDDVQVLIERTLQLLQNDYADSKWLGASQLLANGSTYDQIISLIATPPGLIDSRTPPTSNRAVYLRTLDLSTDAPLEGEDAPDDSTPSLTTDSLATVPSTAVPLPPSPPSPGLSKQDYVTTWLQEALNSSSLLSDPLP
ncbi:proteophosphoglycan ppg4 [Rhodotorula toruloides]|uniref:Proteophosphoglycan ppg4 n=1 Tax=Rhodotorula toruloides TaxID=5286 RepID=A0A511KM56_RHOTO|nr:proteophosphoglycan ppg4 [Rhodotorula toruloides]